MAVHIGNNWKILYEINIKMHNGQDNLDIRDVKIRQHNILFMVVQIFYLKEIDITQIFIHVSKCTYYSIFMNDILCKKTM